MHAILNSCTNFIQAWFSQDCLLCGALSGPQILCATCHASLPRPTTACPVCAAPGNLERCGACLQHPPAFDQAFAALDYTFPVDKLIQAYKYHQQLALAPLFGRLMLQSIGTAPRPDVLLPMPLHQERLRQRGFNQALEIAKFVAQDLQIPLATNCAQRIVNTTSQATLKWDERKKNMRDAFACSAALQGQHIAVIDDVMTSGATLHALSKVLKRAGAQRVSVWIVARASAPQ